jgi:hypothetical protein
MRADQLATAAKTGPAFAPVDRQPAAEAAPLPRGIAVVAEAGAAVLERVAEDVDDGVVEKVAFVA